MQAAGIEACVLKPVKQSRLFERLSNIMANHVSRRTTRISGRLLGVALCRRSSSSQSR